MSTVPARPTVLTVMGYLMTYTMVPRTANDDRIATTHFTSAEKHSTRRRVARIRVLALAALSMAAAGLLVGACSGAAARPTAARGELPGKPELALTYVETRTGIEISWSAPASEEAITGYDVRWRLFVDDWETASGLAGNTMSYAIDDLEAELEYLIQVRASSSAGSGDWSDALVYDAEENSLFRAVAVDADDTGEPDGGSTSPTSAEGTEGDDYIYVEYDSEYYNFDFNIDGLGGDDWISTGAGNDHLRGGPGNDRLDGSEGNDTLDGGPGDDRLLGGPHEDILEGGSGDDILYGSNENDILRGGSGSDDLAGDLGADHLNGGDGDDRLEADRRYHGQGDDTLDGGAGADRFVFGYGQDADTIRDFSFVDDVIDLLWVRTLTSFDELQQWMTADDDATVIILTTYGAGTIRLDGVDPTDLDAANFDLLVWLYGDEGDNILIGERRDNNIDGRGGNDTIVGGHGDDQIVGGTGDDTLTGGRGGGGDRDTFIFAAGHGNDTITDFAMYFLPSRPFYGLDVIDLTQLSSISGFSDLTITTDGPDTVVDLTAHGGGTIRLQNLEVANLRPVHFRFAGGN